MAGHSKWNNIKRRKGAVDEKKGKIFTKLGREIQVAVKEGGADPEANNRLRDIIAKAKSLNMPNDSIQRSIDKAAGDVSGDSYSEIQYEGYGPGGVAVLIRALTDNRNRTAGEVRHVFDKYGGNLGTDGCVAFLFEKKGSLILDRTEYDDGDEIFMDALEAGAEDVDLSSEHIVEIITTPEDYESTRKILRQKYTFLEESLAPTPANWVKLDVEQSEQMQKLIDRLEDNDDIQDVYHNWEQDED